MTSRRVWITCGNDFTSKSPKIRQNCARPRNGSRLCNRSYIVPTSRGDFAISRGFLRDFHANSRAINIAMKTRRDWIDYGKDFAPKSPKIRHNCARPRNSSQLCNRRYVAPTTRGYFAHSRGFRRDFDAISTAMKTRRVWIACGNDFTSISPKIRQNCARSRNSSRLCNRRYIIETSRGYFAHSRGFRRDFDAISRAISTAMKTRRVLIACGNDFTSISPKIRKNCDRSRSSGRLCNRRRVTPNKIGRAHV